MPRLSQFPAIIGFVALSLPAHGLDCSTKAAKDGTVVSAICADPQLLQADKEMNDAYSNLYKGRDKKQQRVVRNMQKDWLWSRKNCDKAGRQCLMSMIHARTEFLLSADGIGPSSQGKLVFKGVYVDAGDGWGGTDISLYEFEKPDTDGKKSFNEAVDKIYAENGGGEQSVAKSVSVDTGNTYDCSHCSITKMMNPPFQVKNFISAPVSEQSDNGFKIYDSTIYINQFLDKRATLAYRDLLQEYDVSLLAKSCYDQVMAGLEDKTSLPAATTGDKASRRPSNEFMGYFRDPANWKFDSKSITFTLPFTDFDQECTISYETLRQHLAEDAVLPAK